MKQQPISLQELVSLLAKIDDKKAISSFLELILTLDEQEEISKRLLIVKELLKKQKSQRQIAEDLKVSIAKITRGSNSLKIVDKEILPYLL